MVVSNPNNTNNFSSLDKLLNKVLALPNWVKQYFYVVLREDLKKTYSPEYLDHKRPTDLIQLYIPTPSATGKRIIQRRFNSRAVNFDLTPSQQDLLKSVGYKKRLIDICNDNKWSLKKCCKVLIECIEKGYVECIENYVVANAVYYLAEKIRLGEYLLRMNKISLNQVDQVLYAQKEAEENFGEKPKIGEMLVNLGYIKDVDKEEIVQFRELSAHKLNIQDESLDLKEQVAKLKSSLETLGFENQALKEDLVFYQEELINKANIIAEIESKEQVKEEKKSFFARLFDLKYYLNRA